MTSPAPAWTPDPAFAEASAIARFMRHASDATGTDIADYHALWDWSVAEPGAFWATLGDFFGVDLTGATALLTEERMPGAVWFPGAEVNYAAQVFRHTKPDTAAILHYAENGTERRVTWQDLQTQVGAVAAGLHRLGIVDGDRVVGYLPNAPDTVIAFLACASIGATWSLCAPDMGAATVLERFRQIAPKAIFTTAGYEFNGKSFDRTTEVAALLQGLPSVAHAIHIGPRPDAARDGLVWHDFDAMKAGTETVPPQPVAFDHPLWVVYSSGTTGSPKAIVHGHGGAMLEGLKMVGLHCDVGPDDVFSWYSSSGWIMWNAQVDGLLSGATIAIAEGNPNHPDATRLWRFIEGAGVTCFGAGAAYYTGCMKAGVTPKDVADLSKLKFLGSTGSPLPPEAYAWLYETVRADLWIAPIAGGTDLAGVFLAGSPTLPVHIGEMQCRALGAAVHAFDEAGNAVTDDVGELVCIRPMPSMPLYLWGDDSGQRLHDSYFDTYPGIWRQGDWVKITPHGSAIIYGRSDATINRYGIRMGTADIYRAVEEMDAVADSLVVDLEYLGKPSCMILFVKLAPGATWDDTLNASIVATLKARVSPHHVPNMIEVAPDIPYTLSGKKMEVPIKKRFLGQDMVKVATPDAMANPGCLEWYDTHAARYLSG